MKYRNGSMTISNLTCNYMTNPIGVDTVPRLSWVLNSAERNQKQTAYRIIAASSLQLLQEGLADLWDSGKVISEESIHVKYEGKPLNSRQKCYWKVSVWDRDGNMSAWSEAAFFEMGILNQEEWQGKWICSPFGASDISKSVPAPHFRKKFFLHKKTISARAYICGLGFHELYINGCKAGDNVLSPAFTKYDKTSLYNSYDVTECLIQGENALGVILGNGWYNSFAKDAWDFDKAPWRHIPKMLLQLYVLYEDGEEIVIMSDRSWKVSTGPILFDGLRNGEYYDARLKIPGWNMPNFDDSRWQNAVITAGPGGVLRSAQLPPVKITKTIEPVRLWEAKPGIWVYDLGQNISGWVQLQVSGHSGNEITLRYSESICEDGSVDQSHIGKFVYSGEFQTDKYILEGGGIEIWEPRFTYHGFQYIQVEGFPGTPTLENIRGRVVHTAFEPAGEFSCSNELINKIQSCVKWSSLTNFHGFPTDCPHREKNGWTGDAMLSAEQMLFNFHVQAAYTKWMRDFKDVQRPSGQLPGIIPTGGWGYNWGSGPAWDSAIVLIPWYMYIYSRDSCILEEMYENMKKYMGFLATMAEDYIVDFGLGDWNPPSGNNRDYKCPSAVTNTAYYYADSVILSKVADILGYKADSEYYASLSEKIRNAFRMRFLDSAAGIIEGNCQTSFACALYQGLINEDEKPLVMNNLIKQIGLKDYHIDCGILGSKYILNVLCDMGRASIAYDMVTQASFPGWTHWISQGATTLWGNWDGSGSHNHHMFSEVSAWFYKCLAGLQPDPLKPGFKHFCIKPNPVGDIKWVKSRYNSMYGRIECNWSYENNEFKLYVKVPVGCKATIYLPASDSENIKESGGPLVEHQDYSVIGNANKQVCVIDVQSGEYCFTSILENVIGNDDHH